MRIRSTPHTTTSRPLALQLRMAFDSNALRGLSVAERARAITHLANLLLLAAGATTAQERDDDNQR